MGWEGKGRSLLRLNTVPGRVRGAFKRKLTLLQLVPKSHLPSLPQVFSEPGANPGISRAAGNGRNGSQTVPTCSGTLTSPVTMYFPSGEKARALRDFLGTRKESSLVPPFCPLQLSAFCPPLIPKAGERFGGMNASSSYTPSVACTPSMSLRELQQKPRALPQHQTL